MAEEYQEFLNFDWSDEGWQSYLKGLYPPPTGKQALKFKKKWYKRNVDPSFDEGYEPPQAPTTPPGGGAATGSSSAPSGPPPRLLAQFADGSRWAVMEAKATICFMAYVVALTTAVGGASGAFPAYQALVVLMGAFVLELLAKYGLKFNSAYLHSVLLDDVGVMPLMSVTLLTPGLHWAIRILALIPASSTALLSFGQICENHRRLPARLKEFFSPLAGARARYQLMKFRAHVEVVLGAVLVFGVFTATAAPFSALLFWNVMIMRYIMSSWTQEVFRTIDGALDPFLGRIPGGGYAALKRLVFSFVDPDKRRGGNK